MNKEKLIEKITWCLSGSAATLLVLAIVDMNPIYWAVGFILLMGSIFAYYMFMPPKDIIETCEGPSDHKVLRERMDAMTEEDWQRDAHDLEIEMGTEPTVMTNSEITAACIKAGITHPQQIEWIQKRCQVNTSTLALEEYIKFIKAQ